MFKRRKPAKDGQAGPTPEEVYTNLRSMALHAAESGVIQRREDHPDVFGILVDIPAKGGHATVVALGDNTTSLYTSTGGGTIGAGDRPEVAAATQRLLAVVQEHLPSITGADDGSLPGPGSVRLHVLTEPGLRAVDVPEDSFWRGSPHSLTAVIAAVQDVITLLRSVTPG